MSEIRCYDYVNHPFAEVRDALTADIMVTALHAGVGGLGVEAEIKISVRNVEHRTNFTRLEVEWEAATLPALFPLMKADISIYPLTRTETQLDFFGHYEPPLGPLGQVLNAVAGHRIAKVSIHHFVTEIAERLRQTVV